MIRMNEEHIEIKLMDIKTAKDLDELKEAIVSLIHAIITEIKYADVEFPLIK